MRRLFPRLFAALLSVFLLVGFAPVAKADVAGLTPCAESARFQQRAAGAKTDQAKARFAMYSQAVCGADGLPHLIVDGRWNHAGDFMIPGADPRLYTEIPEMDALKHRVEEDLAEHNAESKTPMPREKGGAFISLSSVNELGFSWK